MNPHFVWAIGVFEGEGSIVLTRPRKRNGDKGWERARLQLKMTDEDVVRRVHAAFEVGSVTGPYARSEPQYAHWKPQWMWQVTGDAAADLLVLMLPLLGQRRHARALEVLTAHDAAKPAGFAPAICRCGKEFTPVRGNQRFCCQPCRQADYYARKHELGSRIIGLY